MKKTIKINPDDLVAVALAPLKKGESAEGVTLKEDIEKGHKFALKPIAKGSKVIKYGEVIGIAKADIAVGEHIHIHNMSTNLEGTLEYSYHKKEIPEPKRFTSRTVNVYERANGEVGIRNELWVIPTVGCVNSQARAIVDSFNRKHPEAEGIDGCFTFTHPYGCSQIGDDHERTKVILQRMVRHPNCGGVLVLGLGCENNRMDIFRETLGDYDKERTEFLIAQEVADEIAEGTALLEKLYEKAKTDRRVPRDISCLRIGLKCGGSDGLSGITANPLVGRFSDYMAAVGGTTVLTEVPEMFGAEQLLMDRAKDEETFGKIVKLVNGFKEYYQKHDQPVYENPSPGNKAGGITTLEDKSLGCTQKSGTSEVCDVLFDGDALTSHGLNLLNGPGNDMVAVTNLASAGCHMVLFTTGRGTPFGGFVPTVKISTNSELARRKPNWIDFNAGDIAEGESFETRLEALADLVAATASGMQTVNEKYNSRDIAIFKTGVTL
ncbi:altronate dehydratase family protein [Ruminococcus sp.]|uniref:UxaA family hydrolase n=1 Tax=Ruminococcus sp. TaxID=41978 RepID=UPI0025EF76AC|nr:altronate dehydratase family protein [Ruminococcus sp.]MBQ8967428.1 altronate dehydratase [Ruminococcus sp.]